MEISSPVFSSGATIPQKFTCEGDNVSPPLNFKDVPEEAQSLALLMEDPDAPSVKPWVHWVVFNIPRDVKGFEEGSVSKGAIEGLSTGNTYGYQGPCPPQNEHRYFFKLYALDKKLDLPAESDRAALLRAMQGHVLKEVYLMGVYKKQKSKLRQV